MFQTLSQVIRTTKVKSTKLKIVQLRRGRCPLKQGTSGNREKSKPSSTAPNPFSDNANPVPRTAYSTRIVPQQPFLQKQQFETTPFPVSGCYVCGDFTHFQRELPAYCPEQIKWGTTRQKAEHSPRHQSL